MLADEALLIIIQLSRLLSLKGCAVLRLREFLSISLLQEAAVRARRDDPVLQPPVLPQASTPSQARTPPRPGQ